MLFTCLSWLKQPVFLNHQKQKQNRQLINLVPENHHCRKGTSSSKPSFLGSIFFFPKCMRLGVLNSSYDFQRTTLSPDVTVARRLACPSFFSLSSLPSLPSLPLPSSQGQFFSLSQNMAIFCFFTNMMGVVFLRTGVAIRR